MGSLLDDTIRKWSDYKLNCTKTLTSKNVNRSEGASYLYRICTDNGTWLTVENSTDIWRDHSECSELNHHFKQQEDKHALLSVLQLIYTIGYSLSLFSLLLAVLILLLLRKLHCTRNYIHINLFASFMFRAASVLVKDIILHITYAKRPTDETGWIFYFNSEEDKHALLSVLQLIYTIGYSLSLFSLLLAVLVLLLLRLARATLILIPLLGINGFVFAFIVDEQVEGQSRDIRLFSELTINSFQVQAELKKRWRLLFTSHFERAADCILGKHFKYLGKYSKRRPNHYFHQSEFYIDGRRPSSMQFLQVPLRRNAMEYFTRGSVSSSEGEGTLGETLEEILEESEI
ncbi:UNVERIFIED_CONTAM: hypothetical protein FKN15_047844 [Acipenser sinensis]